MKFSKEILDKNRKWVDQLLLQTWEQESFTLHSRLKNIPEKTTFWIKEIGKSYNIYYSRWETDEEVEARLSIKYDEYLYLKEVFDCI